MLFRWTHTVAARRWLAALLPQVSTTADLTRREGQLASGSVETDKNVYCGVSFTHDGLVSIAPRWRDDLAAFQAFREGPAVRAAKLGDRGRSAPEHWRFGDDGHPRVYSAVTLASSDTQTLGAALGELEATAARYDLTVVFVQRAGRLSQGMAGREHFGFRDGLGQPIIDGLEWPSAARQPPRDVVPLGEFVLGYPRAGRHPAEAAPLQCADWMADGAFQIVKRLNQDVAGWRAQLAGLCRCPLSGTPRSEEALAAKLIGRWPGGAPLALSTEDEDDTLADAAFDFEDDPFGRKTPRFAHIRKMYPRIASVGDRSWRRIIRRAVPFGPIYAPAQGSEYGAHADRGLMMNAFVASIDQQFEFLLRGWANDPDFPEWDDGNDPVIGSPSTVVLRGAEGATDALSLDSFVRTTGAIYTFAPSHGTLQRLA